MNEERGSTTPRFVPGMYLNGIACSGDSEECADLERSLRQRVRLANAACSLPPLSRAGSTWCVIPAPIPSSAPYPTSLLKCPFNAGCFTMAVSQWEPSLKNQPHRSKSDKRDLSSPLLSSARACFAV